MRPTTRSTRAFTRTSTRISACAIAIAAALATADARPLHADHHGRNPGAYARAVPDAGGRLERFYGTSVPYDADGPGANDFQLQGR